MYRAPMRKNLWTIGLNGILNFNSVRNSHHYRDEYCRVNPIPEVFALGRNCYRIVTISPLFFAP
jgi:hypothetical protein